MHYVALQRQIKYVRANAWFRCLRRPGYMVALGSPLLVFMDARENKARCGYDRGPPPARPG